MMIKTKEFQNISSLNTSITKDIAKIVCVLFFSFCNSVSNAQIIPITQDLELLKLSDHSYIHTSTILLENGKRFLCNGFVYLNNGEAYIFDSPANDKTTEALIHWLHQEQKVTIKGVVFNHFHSDCTEGINIFKEYNIQCIASKKTAIFMHQKKYDTPDHIFDNSEQLKLVNKIIINTTFGEAHTKDNIVSYFPNEKILFGGCMIKSLNASKGNLADANINEWSRTVTKIKKAYPDIEVVVPGHGAYGDQSLLDYTISLFNTED